MGPETPFGLAGLRKRGTQVKTVSNGVFRRLARGNVAAFVVGDIEMTSDGIGPRLSSPATEGEPGPGSDGSTGTG